LSWDAYQRAVLRELGHDLYALPHMPMASPAEIAESAETTSVETDMLARVAKAAGVPPQALLAQLDLHAIVLSLRDDAAAKRALWPRLRALRRAAQ
jgi:hypothetical protein